MEHRVRHEICPTTKTTQRRRTAVKAVGRLSRYSNWRWSFRLGLRSGADASRLRSPRRRGAESGGRVHIHGKNPFAKRLPRVWQMAFRKCTIRPCFPLQNVSEINIRVFCHVFARPDWIYPIKMPNAHRATAKANNHRFDADCAAERAIKIQQVSAEGLC